MLNSIFVVAALLAADVQPGGQAIAVTFNGTWSGTTFDDTLITYEFQDADTLIWYVDEPNFKKMWPNGLRGKYKVRVTTPKWEIDIDRFESPELKDMKFQGILEIQDAESFRMEGNPVRRPEEFGKEALVFRLKPKAKP